MYLLGTSPLIGTRKARVLKNGSLYTLAMAFLVWIQTASCQAVLPPYPPLQFTNTTGDSYCVNGVRGTGAVSAIVRQPDGGIILGGTFDTVNGLPRKSLARLKPDGTLDADWNPQLSYVPIDYNLLVSALVVDSKGDVYVGGTFTAVGDATRSNLLKFKGSGNGELDTTWHVGTDGMVTSLAIDAADVLYVGGKFTQIGGKQLPFLAKIVNGSVDAQWNPSSPATPRAMVLDAAGNIFIGGIEASDYPLNPLSSDGYLRKYASGGTGAMDPDWDVGVVKGGVAALALDSKGNLYAGGQFQEIGGQPHANIAKVSATGKGKVDSAWGMPGVATSYATTTGLCTFVTVQSIVVDPEGNVYAAGHFDKPDYAQPDVFGDSSRVGLIKIPPNGQVDDTWGLHSGDGDGYLTAVMFAGDRLYFGGNMSLLGSSNPSSKVNFAALQLVPTNLDQRGITGTWYNPKTSGQGFTFQVYPDTNAPGKGLIAGAWYTFSAADSSGSAQAHDSGQRWYYIDGEVDAASSYVNVKLYSSNGGAFDAGPKVSATPIGVGALILSDCGNGALNYTFDDGRTGSVPLMRLTANVSCALQGDTGAGAGNTLLTGLWYNPETSGQGLLVEVNPINKQLFAGWYTFRRGGKPDDGAAGQRWYSLQAPFALGDTAVDAPIYVTSGGVFDTPGAVATQRVGTAHIEFASCSSMTLKYQFDDGLSGTMPLQPTGPVPAGCALQ